MSTLRNCAGVESWQALLTGDLSPEQQEEYERHLESCPACQERLDRAGELEGVLKQLSREFGDPTLSPPDPTLREFLGRLHEVRSTLRASSVEQPDLYFLQPVDRPGVLGVLGGYEVQEVIGQGGMGVVLKAYEPALNRLVAIKVLAAGVAGSAVARKRFAREAQAAAAVCHEHIVTVHGVHETDGLPYLVMQYIAGESLQDRLDRMGPLETVEVVRIGLQTASGLAAAHAQGLIHRDVKPANLLLEAPSPLPPNPPPRDGEGGAGLLAPPLRFGEGAGGRGEGSRVKITDFGLARMADAVQLTQNGVVAGTPEYMSPEQARGETIDHRTDLFSLGSVLYAMCTGVPPFRASTTLALLRQVSEQTPTPVRELNPDAPAWLEAFIDRLMAKNPADRFRSAVEVAELLEGCLAHLRQPATIAAPEFSHASSVRRWFPAWAGVLPASLVVAFVGLVVLLLGLGNRGERTSEARLPPNAPPGNVDVWSVAVSRDGKILAASAGMPDQPGEIGVWDLETQTPLQRFSEELGVASIDLSPSGKLLASGSWSGHVRVWDWQTGKQLFDFPVPDEHVARVAFSPDGQLLATVSESKTAQLWDLVSGKLLADLEGDLMSFHCVTFSPDGKRVLAGGGDWKPGGFNQVTIWDVASKKQVLKLSGHQNTILAIRFSPDGKTIVTGGADCTLCLWEADGGKLLKTFRGHKHFVESVVFSTDGKTLVSGSLDGVICFWDVEKGNETSRVLMRGKVRAVRFTPDGESLIAGGAFKTLKVFASTSKKELATLWNGSDRETAAMDRLPLVIPGAVGKKEGGSAAAFLGLGLAFLVSLSVAVGLAVHRLRAAPPLSSALAGSGPLSLPCAECGKKLKVKAELAGKKVKCPQCGKPILVPDAKPTPSLSPRRRWWAHADVLAAFASSAMFAILLFAGVRHSPAGNEPYVSRIQILADRVKAQRSDTVDARSFLPVADKDLFVLRGLSNLRILNLDGSGITNEGLKEVAHASNLVSLSLTNSQVSDAGLAELKTLTSLDELRLDKLPITDAGLAHLTAFPRLKKLSLYQTAVTDNGLAHLKHLPFLERLSLDNTSIGDEGLRHLSQCPNLKYVSVWQTGATPAGIQELCKARPGLKVNR